MNLFEARIQNVEMSVPMATMTVQRILRERAKVEGSALPAITVSVGIARWETQDEPADSLVARADGALYAAERNGRNRMEVSSKSNGDSDKPS